MKKYQVTISEIQVWKIIKEVKAVNEGHAEKEAMIVGNGKVITETMKDVDYAEVIDVFEIKTGIK